MLQIAMAMPSIPTMLPTTVDPLEMNFPADFPPVTNLCFWGIERGSNFVSLGIAWPFSLSFTNDFIDLYGNWHLASNGWKRLLQIDVGGAVSNAVVDVPFDLFPTNAMEGTAFFRLASQDDADGDGLSDAYESWASGTSPAVADTDGDGITDAQEVSLGTDPLSSDTDEDGLLDGDEVPHCSSVTPSQTFNFHVLTNLTEALRSSPGGVVSCALLVPVVLQGVTVTNVTVDARGIVYFNRPGYANPEVPRMIGQIGQDVMDGNCLTVSAYGGNLAFSGESSVCVSAAVMGGVAYEVIEFSNMICGTNSISFLVATRIWVSDKIHIWYSDVLGDAVDGRNASVGFQTFSGRDLVSCLDHEEGGVYDGLGLTFMIGFGTDPTDADSDGDGLLDGEEVNTLGTNPCSTDTDGDGLSDDEEVDMYGTDPLSEDSDGDGLHDGWEVANQLNPLSPDGDDGASADLDSDGLSSLQEQALGTDPRNADSDEDGVSDGGEVLLGTSPTVADTDRDGLPDGVEIAIGTNPLQPDSDGDGMNDGWEYANSGIGFDPTVDNATDTDLDNNFGADPDGDGLTNGQECAWGTNPSGLDSDNDGIADGYDTDGDGVGDGAEIAQNSDPADASDGGIPNSRVPVPFYFGDPSGSHSEKYRLTVTPMEGVGGTPKSYSWLNENYGQCETKTAMLMPGWRYEVRMEWVACNHPHDGSYYPNYDYTLSLAQDAPSNVVLDDPDSLFRSNYYGGDYYGASHFPVLDAVATITVYAITNVAICKPDDSSWSELEESRVVLDDEELRIKVEITPQISSLAQCRQAFGSSLTIKTSGTCPSGAPVPIGDDASLVNSSGKSEIRIAKTRQQLISLGLLPESDDGVNEMAWLDMGSTDASQPSNLTDSEAFSALGYQFRGKATIDSSKTLESTPPNSVPSESFLKAAGCEIVSVGYGNTESSKRQIMNQADYFYYSGHGSFTDGALQSSRNPIVYGFTPSLVTGRWGGGLDCVIFAGCSVLNIGDFRSRSFMKWKTKARYWFRKKQSNNGGNPGMLWENIGAKYLLGYCWTAPLDTQGATAVASMFVQNLKNNMSAIDAWRNANSSTSTLNACAIDVSSIPHRFWYWDETSGVPVWTNVVKGVQSW